MDPLEVAKLVEELKLTTDAKEDGISLTPDLVALTHERASRCLIGRIFASRVTNREALRTNLPRILQIQNNIDVEIVGDNLFLVAFSSQSDHRHTLLHGPWHFFQSLMIFKEPKGLQKPSEVRFDDFSIWIQLHNLPVSCMDPTIIRRVGEKLGIVEEVDMGEGGNCMGMYARVRVRRSVELPLRRCIPLNLSQNSDTTLILLRYERLPDLCFACGRLTHTIRACDDASADKKNLKFGVWLKAGRTMDTRRKQIKDGNNIEEQIRSSMPSDKENLDGTSSNAHGNTSAVQVQQTAGSVEERIERDDLSEKRNSKAVAVQNSDIMIIEPGPHGIPESTRSPPKLRKNPLGRGWKRLARNASGNEHGPPNPPPSDTHASNEKRKATSEPNELMITKYCKSMEDKG